MKGWFDAFRNDGGPTLYSFSNRTAVTGDVSVITILTVFVTIYVAFLIIFPGIRKEKFTTFVTVTLSLLVGATILVSLFGSCWHKAETTIVGTYKAFSNEKISGHLGAYVGLKHVNITLQAVQHHNWTADIDFNERFDWINSYQMSESFKAALHRGLPFPILTVAEYFTTGQEGLAWGGQYRSAGYFAMIMLWTSFVTWILMNLMLIVVPRYGALLMTSCGLLLLATASGYFGMLPEAPLEINIEGSTLSFKLGWCFWLTVLAGSICLLIGVIITTVEIINPHSFSTILEVNYDTPYDRHIIIEDSRGTKNQKKCAKLEQMENLGLGSRILRRLSSKQKDQNTEDYLNSKLDCNTLSKRNSEISEMSWKYPYKDALMCESRNKCADFNQQDDDIISAYSLDDSLRNKNIFGLNDNKENTRVSEIPMW